MSNIDKALQENLMTAAVKIAALTIIVVACFQVLSPFLSMVLWASVIAIGLYPSHLAISEKLGGREKLSAALLVLAGLAVVLLPAGLLAESSVGAVESFAKSILAGEIRIPPPDRSVADWPLVGKRIFATWSDAAANLEDTLNKFAPQLQSIGQALARFAGSSLIGILQFIVSIAIAGALLLSADGGYRTSRAIARNLSEQHGDAIVDMSIATVRSVAKGVLGVAVIQSIASAIGLLAIGVPAAGLWAFLILILAIVQLPPLLVLGPIIVWVFSVNSGVSATIFAVYAIVVSASDSFLKPILLGRGMDIPMLVLLLGAIGGASALGIIGLFMGAVILAVGYKILEAWTSAAADGATDELEPSGGDG